jgi:hypothetical protein
MKLKAGIALIGAIVVCATLLPLASSTLEPKPSAEPSQAEPSLPTLEPKPSQAKPSAEPSLPTLQFDCAYLKTEAIDPIVDPAVSHDHDFYGNTGVGAQSTYESMSASGQGTTCHIHEATSSYWQPQFRDAGKVQKPLAITNYYRDTGTLSPDMQPIPDGLQIIASVYNGDVKYRCGKEDSVDSPPVGCTQDWRAIFQFPNCWNPNAGKGPNSVIFSPRSCPYSYPYEFPQLQMALKFPRPADGALDAPVEVSMGGGEWGLASEYAHADRFDADQNPEFDNRWLGPCVLDVPAGTSSPERCENARAASGA